MHNKYSRITYQVSTRFESACNDYVAILSLDELKHNECHSFGDALHIHDVHDTRWF